MENSRLREAAPTSVNVTVGKRRREYLADREVERLIDAAKQNRSGHRDATAKRCYLSRRDCSPPPVKQIFSLMVFGQLAMDRRADLATCVAKAKSRRDAQGGRGTREKLSVLCNPNSW